MGVKTILKPLTAAFKLSQDFRRAAYHRGWLRTRRLNRPVISIGNITVGGSGKTPLVAYIAQVLLRAGWHPAILTRGYGRRRGPKLIALEPGAARNPDPREVGDEPTLLAKALPGSPIVICADRYRAGRLAEDRFHTDVHILDDGFQHLCLARDVDVVLLDATQNVFESALLPAGRLREPVSALARAHMLVLTRTELGGSRSLEALVLTINPRARIFHAVTRLCGLRDLASGELLNPEELRGKPVLAFCGLGNSNAFWANLRGWGFQLAAEFAFRDHHVYSLADLHRLTTRGSQIGAAALLTTEKDALNLPPGWKSQPPLVACVIEAEVREAEAFRNAITACLDEMKVGVR
jgi:tetraacyldisaccharide 4'-kinase